MELTSPLLHGDQATPNPLAAVVVVADWAVASGGARAAPHTPCRARAFGLDAFAAAVAHAAAFWGLYTLAAAFDSPLTTLAAALTYHLAAAATAASLLAATADATGPAPRRPLGPVAVAGALFCVSAGAFSFLFCWKAVVATQRWW